MRLFLGHTPGTFALIPTVVLSLGRCECCDKLAGISIMLTWLGMEIGLEIPFFK